MFENAYVSIGSLKENQYFLDNISKIAKTVDFSDIDRRPTISELEEIVQKYEILIVGVGEKLTEEAYKKASKLKVIGTLTIGLDHICNKFIEDKKFKIINISNANILSVAEHTLCMILSITKKVKLSNQAMKLNLGRKGIGERPIELYGKTVGIIGFGKIGKRVIELLKPFGVNIIGQTNHPEKHQDLINKYGIKMVSLEEMFKTADIITIHVPLNSETECMIDSDLLNKTKKNCIIVNTSRQGLIDMNCLYKLAESNHLYGVGLDIDIDEYGFSKLDNCYVSPHIAGGTIEAVDKIDKELIDNMIIELL
ncbi:MAG: D-isomer specific 2-hydroxyacid dehydrogenase family protein [Ignavibacteriales bacterium]